MTTDPSADPLAMTARDRLELYLALQQPATYITPNPADDDDGHYTLPPEAVRCLRLLLHAMQQIPLPQDGPAACTSTGPPSPACAPSRPSSPSPRTAPHPPPRRPPASPSA